MNTQPCFSSVLSDSQITLRCTGDKPLIDLEHFVSDKVNTHSPNLSESIGFPSYGLSSAGYDSRSTGEFKLIREKGYALDPRQAQDYDFTRLSVHKDHTGEYVLIPPKAIVLTSSLEYYHIPRDLMATVMSKSTYARIGVYSLTTPLEPGWSGNITYEIVNFSPRPAKVYILGGLVQIIFHPVFGVDKDYVQRGGKYQNQTGIQSAHCDQTLSTPFKDLL